MDHNSRIANFNARWRRNCLNTYWMVLFLSLLGSGLNILLLSPDDPHRQDLHLFEIISCLQLVLIILSELALRSIQRYLIEVLIVLGAILSATLCILNKEPGILFVLVLPILVPTFLGQHSKILFSLFSALVTYFLLLLFDDHLKGHANPNEIILHVSVMVAFAFITIGIHKRGKELLDILMRSIEEKQEMERIARKDALTGLANHRSFYERLDQQMEAYALRPYPLYLLLFDLDSFKKVNDTYGHLAGDMALRYVASVLRDQLREDDVAFRYGGEEFAVLLSYCSETDALRIADQIREAIAKQSHPELGGNHLTVSIGVSRYRAGIKKEDFFGEADACLYEAKHTGKNKVVVHRDIYTPPSA